MRNSRFIPVIGNLYIILTPRIKGKDSCMEDFFDKKARAIPIDGRYFDPSNDADTVTTYSKYVFATKVVRDMKSSISFDNFNDILKQIVEVIEHHGSKTD